MNKLLNKLLNGEVETNDLCRKIPEKLYRHSTLYSKGKGTQSPFCKCGVCSDFLPKSTGWKVGKRVKRPHKYTSVK